MKKLNSNDKVDLVILWVDGNDPRWIKEKNSYLHLEGDTGENRFRDCDNLQYLFRGIEKYANWVNRVFFITWGHLPKWLDTTNPKLRIVKHEEFIPKKYLPTFNSNVIELNLHRIKDLSEEFILFNDDLFILKDTKKEDFFINGLPTDIYAEKIQIAGTYNDTFHFMVSNILSIINQHFNKMEVIKKNKSKMINHKYGKSLNIQTQNCLKYKNKFVGFKDFHTAQPYLKTTFKIVWEKESKLLDEACCNKFRTHTDLGHMLCRIWQLLEGNFVPKKDETKYFKYLDDNSETVDAIINRKYKIICINDAYLDIDFEKAKKVINIALDNILPEKSSFEK